MAVAASKRVVGLAVLLPLLTVLAISEGLAQDDSATKVKLITDTADRICGIVDTSSETKSVVVKGKIDAELQRLARAFLNLGVGGAGEITSTSTKGVLQEQLEATLKDIRDCKKDVFNTLQIKLLTALPSQPPAGSAPSAFWKSYHEDNDWRGATNFINACKPSDLDDIRMMVVLLRPPFAPAPDRSANDYRFYVFCRPGKDGNVQYEVNMVAIHDAQNNDEVSHVIEPLLRNLNVRIGPLYYSQFPPSAGLWYVEKIPQ